VAVISSVSDRDPASLRELRDKGLVPGAAVRVIQRNHNASLILRVEESGAKVRISDELAGMILIRGD
jgi:hypothetical protein